MSASTLKRGTLAAFVAVLFSGVASAETFSVAIDYCRTPHVLPLPGEPDECVPLVHTSAPFTTIATAQDHAKQLHRDGLIVDNGFELLPSCRFRRVQIVVQAAPGDLPANRE